MTPKEAERQSVLYRVTLEMKNAALQGQLRAAHEILESIAKDTDNQRAKRYIERYGSCYEYVERISKIRAAQDD